MPKVSLIVDKLTRQGLWGQKTLGESLRVRNKTWHLESAVLWAVAGSWEEILQGARDVLSSDLRELL